MYFRTLISKSNSDGSDIVYAVSITEASLTFHYRPNSIVTDYTSLVISGIYLSSNFWHHVAVTVYENDFALYINGSIENATGLIGAISDSQLDVYLGQTAPSKSCVISHKLSITIQALIITTD